MRVQPHLLRQLPDLDELGYRLRNNPDAILDRALPPPGAEREIAIAVGPPGATQRTAPWDEGSESARMRDFISESGGRAIQKVSERGTEADLDPDERLALEAIIAIEGRPAILIQEGAFYPLPKQWAILEPERSAIEANLRSVGRIEVDGHPMFDWVGTGFLVADDVVMTNEHVVSEFARESLAFKPGMSGRIDYIEEFQTTESAEFPILEVLAIHPRFDLALMRIDSAAGTLPPPLAVSSSGPGSIQGAKVYTVGYPAWDGRRNEPEPMRRIFSDIYNVKRLQPGELTASEEEERVVIHDCSTLGGNSGSCVIDLESHQVVGLHFYGRYMVGNKAIALWSLKDDPVLKRAGVNFI